MKPGAMLVKRVADAGALSPVLSDTGLEGDAPGTSIVSETVADHRFAQHCGVSLQEQTHSRSRRLTFYRA